MTRFAAPIAEQIWDMKYRFKQADGAPIDLSVEDTWRRIARDLAGAEAQPEDWEDSFYQALEDFKFLPAGRIIAGAGEVQATLRLDRVLTDSEGFLCLRYSRARRGPAD